MILLQKIGVYGIMRYFIDNKIGEPGGFGDVYDCHSELGDRYAIKMLKQMMRMQFYVFKKKYD